MDKGAAHEKALGHESGAALQKMIAGSACRTSAGAQKGLKTF
uniref:Uncharacterized protein n=1 Tax=Klebsiella oxytoca TaxID=571 RepID=A0A1Z3MM88_KLEOX|nr:hypothetical protein [Klebsiella oxytoca]